MEIVISIIIQEKTSSIQYTINLHHLFVHMLLYNKHLSWYVVLTWSQFIQYSFCYPATSELMAMYWNESYCLSEEEKRKRCFFQTWHLTSPPRYTGKTLWTHITGSAYCSSELLLTR
jgi:hypothetical protein